jgi:hypothetical protein
MVKEPTTRTEELRRRIARAVAAGARLDRLGVTTVAVAAGALGFFLFFLCDYVTGFPVPVRLLLTVLAAAGIVWLLLLWRRGVWRRESDIFRMALQVEDHACKRETGGFRSLLISAIQFDAQPDPSGSEVLQNRVISGAQEPALAPDKVELHDKGLSRRSRRLAAAALVVYALWIFLAPGTFPVFWQRALGFDAEYPTATEIVRVEYPSVAPQYGAVDVVVEARGELPPRGRVLAEYAGESPFELELLEGSQPGLYAAHFEAPPADIRFSVELGDDSTETCVVRIVHPPALASGTVTVTPPEYTRRPVSELSLGNVDMPENGKVSFVVTPDRPVASCELELDDGSRLPFVKTGTHFELVDQTFEASRRFAVRLVDSEGIENSDRITYSLRILRDRAPVVVLERPESDRYWAPVSRLRWRLRATDDYGIVKAVLRCRMGEITADGKAKYSGKKTIDLGELSGDAEVVLSGSLDLSDLGVSAGRILSITAELTDSCDFRDGSQTGESVPARLHIVSPEELRRIIEEEEQQITRTIDDLSADVDRQIRIIEMRKELLEKP